MTTPLLFNPIAGRGRLAERLEALCAGRDVRLVAASGPRECEDIARRLGEEHARVLVAGGDGTVHHALRGLHGSSAACGFLPAGTGNDFALALGMPADLPPALDRCLRGTVRRVDLGFAENVPFGGIAGIGLVAEVLDYLDRFTRRFRGNWIYPWAVLRTVAAYRPLDVTVDTDAGGYEGGAMLVLAANAPRFGGGMRAAPDASMDDGRLDVVVLRRVGRLQLLRLLPLVYRGLHVGHPACSIFRTPAVRLGSNPAATVYADGEAMPVRTATEIRIRAAAGALRVVL